MSEKNLFFMIMAIILSSFACGLQVGVFLSSDYAEQSFTTRDYRYVDSVGSIVMNVTIEPFPEAVPSYVRPLWNVSVVLFDKELVMVLTERTNSDGIAVFNVSGLQKGDYYIKTEYYAYWVLDGVEVVREWFIVPVDPNGVNTLTIGWETGFKIWMDKPDIIL